MKKIIPSIALAAALAMGTVPAFAAPGDFDNANPGKTEVEGQVEPSLNPSIKATIPLKVVVAMGSVGGGELQTPTADAMYIQNIGTGAIKVTNVEVTDVATSYVSGVVVDNGDGSWSDDSGSEPTDNRIMFTWKTASNYTYLTSDHPLAGCKADMTTKGIIGTGAKAFVADTIQPAGQTGDKLAVTLGGRHFFASALDAALKTDTLCNLKITIGAAA